MDQVTELAPPPRIVLVVSHLYPTLGLERAALELVSIFAADHRVDVVSIGDNQPGPDGLDVLVLGPKRTKWQRVRSLRALRRYARGADPRSVYVAVGVWASIPWLLMAPRLAARTLVWEHSMSREKVASSRNLRVQRALARVLFARAAAVVCVGDVLAGDVAGMNPRIRTVIIGNALPVVDEATLIGRLAARRTAGTRLLAVGSLTHTKNQEVALHALAALPTTFTLTVAGGGQERLPLEQLAGRLDLADRIRFVGQIDPASVAALYRDADMLVHPALGETFGYVYFEAADAGLPVVSLDHRVAREFIPALVPGVLFDGGATDLAEKVLQLAAGPADPEQPLLARARRAGRFDPGCVRERWVELVRQLDAGTPISPDVLERMP